MCVCVCKINTISGNAFLLECIVTRMNQVSVWIMVGICQQISILLVSEPARKVEHCFLFCHSSEFYLKQWNFWILTQVSKALLAEYIAAQKRGKPFKALGLEHMNKPCPVIPSQLTSSTLQCSQFQVDLISQIQWFMFKQYQKHHWIVF